MITGTILEASERANELLAQMTNLERREAFQWARAFLCNGIGVLPVRCDGSKRIAISWKQFQTRLATLEEITDWFLVGHEKFGVAIVCGAVSGGLEAIDIEVESLFEPWLKLIPEQLSRRLKVVKTPRGWHIFYRCDVVSPVLHLAKDKNGKLLIETRGQGNLATTSGSPACTHESGIPYSHVLGPEFDIPRITSEERTLLHKAAASFNELKPKVITKKPEYKPKQFSGNEGLVEWFDREGTPIIDILEPHGWTVAGESCGAVLLRRPGKTTGNSASLKKNDKGEEVLTVFSSAAHPLECKSYGRFNLVKQLEFGGNGSEAFSYIKREFRS